MCCLGRRVRGRLFLPLHHGSVMHGASGVHAAVCVPGPTVGLLPRNAVGRGAAREGCGPPAGAGSAGRGAGGCVHVRAHPERVGEQSRARPGPGSFQHSTGRRRERAGGCWERSDVPSLALGAVPVTTQLGLGVRLSPLPAFQTKGQYLCSALGSSLLSPGRCVPQGLLSSLV